MRDISRLREGKKKSLTRLPDLDFGGLKDCAWRLAFWCYRDDLTDMDRNEVLKS